ncbi:hypothetical protein CLOM_g21287 [Closterium sp. NIES-68]|nr:hypothetical protein CLOM_g21287 [Closterium sp. NIES-68]GJP78575.1 hypothetical protein CLOP_g8862 [Closterium sp. NIES-67]
MRDGQSHILSFPDEILQAVLSHADYSDHRSVAFTCSRFHRLSRLLPRSLHVDCIPNGGPITTGEWLKELNDFLGVFTLITTLSVEIRVSLGDRLLAGVGADCPKLDRLKLVGACGDFFTSPKAWKKFAGQCSRLTSLELHSLHTSYSSRPALPPVDSFPSLQPLTLRFAPRDISPLLRCCSLTSLTLCNPTDSTLTPLASSSFSSSLQSLTIHSGNLDNHLSGLSSFSNLSSLSLHSSVFDPCDVLALSSSLRTLTTLTIHDCPLACTRGVASLARSNPNLSSLSLTSDTYRLFSCGGLETVLHLCGRKLQSLKLSGLPSFRPGLLADCSSLRLLALEGAQGSLEGLVGMLVRVEERGEAVGVEGVGRGQGAMVRPREGVTAAAAATEASPAVLAAPGGSRVRGRRRYVDIRTAAAAADADTVSSLSDVVNLVDAAEGYLGTARMEIQYANQFIVHSPHLVKESIGRI